MAATKESFTFTLTRLASHYRTELTQNFAKNGHADITPDYWIVLEALWKEDNISISMLAKRTCKDNAGLSRILDGMERNDLVNRIVCAGDKRSYSIVLTKYAQGLKEKLQAVEEETLQQASKGLNPIETMELRRMLNHMFSNLEK